MKRDLFLQLYTNLDICSLLAKCQQISEGKISTYVLMNITSFQNIELHASKSHLTPLGSQHLSKKFHTAPDDDGVVSLRLCFRRSTGAHVEAAMPLTTAIPSLIVVKSIPFCQETGYTSLFLCR